MKKRRIAVVLLLIIGILAAMMLPGILLRWKRTPYLSAAQLASVTIPDWITPDLIDWDGHARTGRSLEAFRDIAVHYVGNPGTTAQNNRDYFNNSGTVVSSHFVIGLDGEILQCLPLNERSCATNWRNRDTISIEVCHPHDDGQFLPATYHSLVKLVAWLAQTGNLTPDHVIRHYDVTGKECPRYYVRHPEAWDGFKADVAAALQDNA